VELRRTPEEQRVLAKIAASLLNPRGDRLALGNKAVLAVVADRRIEKGDRGVSLRVISRGGKTMVDRPVDVRIGRSLWEDQREDRIDRGEQLRRAAKLHLQLAMLRARGEHPLRECSVRFEIGAPE